jgi:hypothetical protein
VQHVKRFMGAPDHRIHIEGKSYSPGISFVDYSAKTRFRKPNSRSAIR